MCPFFFTLETSSPNWTASFWFFFKNQIQVQIIHFRFSVRYMKKIQQQINAVLPEFLQSVISFETKYIFYPGLQYAGTILGDGSATQLSSTIGDYFTFHQFILIL